MVGRKNYGFLVVEGKTSSISDFKQYSGPDNETEPVFKQSIGFGNETEPINQAILSSQNEEKKIQTVQIGFSEVYGEIGFISAFLFIRFRNRRNRL